MNFSVSRNTEISIYGDIIILQEIIMKEIRQKKDKGVSAIIATILLIAITVVLAATLVTILGGFTHGVSNSVVTVGAKTQETSYYNNTTTMTTPTGLNYIVYANVSSSSSSLSTTDLTVTINGVSQGTFSSFLSGHEKINSTASTTSKPTTNTTLTNPTHLTGGSNFAFNYKAKVTSLELVYKGNVIYNSGTITIS